MARSTNDGRGIGDNVDHAQGDVLLPGESAQGSGMSSTRSNTHGGGSAQRSPQRTASHLQSMDDSEIDMEPASNASASEDSEFFSKHPFLNGTICYSNVPTFPFDSWDTFFTPDWHHSDLASEISETSNLDNLSPSTSVHQSDQKKLSPAELVTMLERLSYLEDRDQAGESNTFRQALDEMDEMACLTTDPLLSTEYIHSVGKLSHDERMDRFINGLKENIGFDPSTETDRLRAGPESVPAADDEDPAKIWKDLIRGFVLAMSKPPKDAAGLTSPLERR